MLEVRVCGGVEVEVDGHLLPESLLGGRQGRLVLAYLACERERAVRREELADLLWPESLPETWTTSLSAVISRLRRLFTEAGLDGTAVIASTPGAYQLLLPVGARVDLEEVIAAVAEAEDAAGVGAPDRAIAAANRAEGIAARGFLADDCEWVDARRDALRDLRVRAALARSAAHLDARAYARACDAARRALELDDTKEAAYRQLMLALAAAGERAEALRMWERCRVTLVDELGIDPSPETEAVYLQLLDGTPVPPTTKQLPSGVVTFLLTDIVESTAMWDAHTEAMATALERHDDIVARVVAAHGGTLLKSKLEGDATVSVFARATEGASAALALLDALDAELWPEAARPRVRMAMHTGEAFERGGDYFGPALNRAARLRGLADANQVLLSQAVAELVRDHLPSDVVLKDRGLQNLRGLSRGENVFELTKADAAPPEPDPVEALDRPPVPGALAGTGPFVGRGNELAQLDEVWARTNNGELGAVFVGGEPGVGKSRLAGEIAQRVYAAGGLVLYGRCDEDLAAPLQPFIETVRMLVPAMGVSRLRAVRGVDEITRVVPELTELLGEQPGTRADPDTERLALFDAVTQLLAAAADDVPVLLVLDDLHWAGKTTLSLLRHVLRGAKQSRLLVVGTYRDTELARTHPLAETLADLRRETDPLRITLGGLAEVDVAAYLDAIGNTDRELGRELAEVTAGNPFFLIEVVRHVEESGGVWQRGALPEGVREATGRRLSRLSDAANDALAVAAVVGARFDLALVEQVRGTELIDPIAEAVRAGLVVEEAGSLASFRFAHALVRQVLLSELVSLKRVRLHRQIAELLEAAPAAADADARLADLAYHWFECASAGSAEKAVAACRTAADRAMERLAYEEAGDLYGMALQALEWIDDADAETEAALHLARCDALLTAGDVAGARDAIDALEHAAAGSERLAAWYTTYEGLLAVLGEPDRLTEIVQSIGAAAGAMHDADDLRGEAKARYVHALALERLGQIGAAERSLDVALAAARNANDRRLADAILAEAPPAALWGPRPVTRASGSCLDVVRVLRITSGTPAVEAVALRCQAVLEALRGRTDAARRMIASSRRTVEQLGLTHRRLEAEMAAGLIELLAGEAETAEQHLRGAYEGLRDRGLGGEAAQAAAFLGRALVIQGRFDEADECAAQAQELAGSDLKAAITWRGVRAEAALRRGDTDRALALAREAVELASATDALALVADARLTLATVLRAIDDVAGADAEARLAVEACDAKGATVMAGLARSSMSVPMRETATPGAAPAVRAARENLAFATVLKVREAFNRADWDAVDALEAPSIDLDDRRPIVGIDRTGDELNFSGKFAHAGGGRLETPELLATGGNHAALCRWMLRGPDFEVPYLAVHRVNAHGLLTASIMFAPEALDEARAELEAISVEPNLAVVAARRIVNAYNRGDWDAMNALAVPGRTIDDRRPIVGMITNEDEDTLGAQFVHGHGGRFELSEVVATRGDRKALCRWAMRSESSETLLLGVTHVNPDGRVVEQIWFEPEAFDDAMTALGTVDIEPNFAMECVVRNYQAFNRGDLETVNALASPTRKMIDRRLIVGAYGADDGNEWSAEVIYAAGGRFDPPELLATRGDRAVLCRWVLRGPNYEAPYLAIARVDAQGRIEEQIQFDVEALDDAFKEFAKIAPDWALENEATRAVKRVHEAFNAHDWDAARAQYTEDWTQDDRRSVISMPLDNEQSIASQRMIFDGGGKFINGEVLAIRGQRCAVFRTTLHVPDPEVVYSTIVVSRTDERGLTQESVVFDVDDVDGALAELDRMYAEHEGNAAWRVTAKAFEALDQRDWERFVAALTPAVVFEDRRQGVRLRFEGEVALREWRRLVDLAESGVKRTLVDTRGDRLVLTRDRTWFRDGDSGVAEIESLGIIESGPDGRIVSVVSFDVDDMSTAVAELDRRHAELTGGNAAWLANAAFVAALNRRDWPGVVACVDPSFVYDDNRRAVRMSFSGDEALTTWRFLFDLEEFGDRRELVATRGDTLALVRGFTWFRDGHAGIAEVESLGVVETGPNGLMLRFTGFDGDSLEAATAALDQRYAQLDSDASGNEAWRAARRLGDALLRRDWPAFLAELDPDVVMRDGRRTALLDFDREHALESWRITLSLEQLRYDQTLLATRGEYLALTRDRIWFVDQAAGPSEVEFLLVTECAPDGRIRFSVSMDADDLDAAYEVLDARYAELTTGNAAWRAAQRLRDALVRGDWSGFVAEMAPDLQFTDRRRGMKMVLAGAEALETWRIVLEMDEFGWDQTLLATRGDSLALMRDDTWTAGGDAGRSEVSDIALVEWGPEGVRRITGFDPDAIVAAYAALDERHAELNAAERTTATEAVRRRCDALARRDWQGLLDTLAPGYVFVDNRPGLRQRYEGDDALHTFRMLLDLDDFSFEQKPIATRGDLLVLTRNHTWFVNDETGPSEVDSVSVIECTPSGRITAHTGFELADIDAAYALLDARAARPQGNAAWEAELGLNDALTRQDWEALARAFDPHFVNDDHRQGMRTRLVGADALRTYEQLRAATSVLSESELLATRGDRLALVRLRVAFEGGSVGPSEVVMLSMIESGSDGRIAARCAFDEDDRDAAYAALDARAAELQGNRAWRAMQRLNVALNSRDWDAYDRVIDPAFVSIDHRPHFGGLTVDGARAREPFDQLRAMEDFRIDVDLIATRGDNLALTRYVTWFTDDAVGPSEVAILCLVESGPDGRIRSHTAFDPEEPTVALAALDARDAELSADQETTATRLVRRRCDALNARDWPALLESVDPGYVFEDNRRGIRQRLEGDEALAASRALIALDDFRLEQTVIATRGDRLVLTRNSTRFVDGVAGPAHVESLSLMECGPSGKIVFHTNFSIEDLAAAYELLEARAAEPQGNAAWAAEVRVNEALNRRDWDEFAQAIDPALVNDDRRRGMRVRVTGADALQRYEDLRGTEQHRIESELLAVRGERLALTRLSIWVEGGAVGPSEVEMVVVVESGPDGRVAAHTSFDVDDLDAAYAALDARFAASEGNAAWAAHQRLIDALNTRELERVRQVVDPEFVGLEIRPGSRLRITADEFLRLIKWQHEADESWATAELLATRGDHLALTRDIHSFQHGLIGPSELALLCIVETGPDGRVRGHTSFDVEDLDRAYAALDARFAELEGNEAWAAQLRMHDALNRRDWDAWRRTFDPEFVVIDDRQGIRLRLTGDEALQPFELLRTTDDFRLDGELLATRGQRLALFRSTSSFEEGPIGPSEVLTLTLVESGPDGRLRSHVTFDIDELDAAYIALDARAAELVSGNRATRAISEQDDALARRDLDRFLACFDPSFEYDDRRSGIAVRLVGPDAIASPSMLFEMDRATLRRRVIETLGDRLAVTEVHIRGSDGAVGEIEASAMNVLEVGEDGRLTCLVAFDIDEREQALSEMHRRHGELAAETAQPPPNLATRNVAEQDDALAHRDIERWRACFDPAIEWDDRRSGLGLRLIGAEAIASMRMLFEMDEARLERRFIATLGDRLAVLETHLRGSDGAVGPLEVSAVNVMEMADDGRTVRIIIFDGDERDRALAEMRRRAVELADPLAIPRNRAARVVEQPDWTRISALGEELCLHATSSGFVLHEVDESGTVLARVEFGEGERAAAANEIARRFDLHHQQPDSARAMMLAINAHDTEAVRAAMSDSAVFEDHRQLRLSGFDGPDRYVALLAETLALAPDYHIEVSRVYAIEPWGQATLSRGVGTTAGGGPFETVFLSVSTLNDAGLVAHVAVYEPEDVDAAVARLYELGPDEVHGGNAALGDGHLAVSVIAAQDAAFARRDVELWRSYVDPAVEFDDRRAGIGVRVVGDAAIASMQMIFDMDHAVMDRRSVVPFGDRVVVVETLFRGSDGAVGDLEIEGVGIMEVGDDGRQTRNVIFDLSERERVLAEAAARAAELADPLSIPRNRAARVVEQPGWTLIASIEENLCIHRTAGGVVLHEVDATGAIVAGIQFGPDQHADAVNELQRRFGAHHGVDPRVNAMTEAMNARDPAAVRACLADTAVIEDHRRLRVTDFQGPDSYVELLAGTISLSSEYLVELLRVDAVEPWGSVGLVRMSGTLNEGGTFETWCRSLTVHEAGLVTHIEIFEPEDVDAAVERFRSLAP